jgi:hypothetical protein
MRRTCFGALAVVLVALVQSSSGAASGSPPKNEAGASLFSRSDLLELALDAPFQELFDRARSDADYAVEGRLTATDPQTGAKVEVPGVTIGLRGHTSKNAIECEFPKLKVTFPADQPSGSPFAGIEQLKIGTHCGDREDSALTPQYGRLANDKAPHREALVYRLLAAAGVPTLRVRPARITYASAGGGAGSGTPPLARNALLLEDDHDAVERLGGTGQITEEQFDSAKQSFSVADTAKLAFAEAMIGNFDWCLRFAPGDQYRCDNRHPLWNIVAVTRSGAPALPAIYDFDLSGPVVGRHDWFRQVYSTDFADSRSPVDVEVLGQLQRTRSLFDRGVLTSTRAGFVKHKPAILQTLADAIVDDEGRRQAEAYLKAFFRLIENDAEFYLPVVVRPETRAFMDPETSRPACGAGSVVPVGTPVTGPLETRGELVQVRVLDAFWQWTDPKRCDAIHREPVWIPSAAIDANYPR